MITRAEVVEEGAKVSQIIRWLLYLCIKPETSKINVTKAFRAIVIFPVFPHVSHGNFGHPDYYWAVLALLYCHCHVSDYRI